MPDFGPSFKWKEPLAVRRELALELDRFSWPLALKRAAIVTVPLALLFLFVTWKRPPKGIANGGPFVLFMVGCILVLGLLVALGIPLTNRNTRRSVLMKPDRIVISSGFELRGSRHVMPIIDIHLRDDVDFVRFGYLTHRGRSYRVLAIKLHRGDSVVVGIHKRESTDEIRRHMAQWGYRVANAADLEGR
jgi:hypothetical protein